MKVLNEEDLKPYLLNSILQNLLQHGNVLMVAIISLKDYKLLSANHYLAKAFQLSFFEKDQAHLFDLLTHPEKKMHLELSSFEQKPILNLLYKHSDNSPHAVYAYEDSVHKEALLLLQPQTLDDLHTIEKMTEVTAELAQLTRKLKKSNYELQESREGLIYQARFSTVGEIISMLAHQWRQPLSQISAIVSNLEISMHLHELSKQDILTKLQSINGVTQHLSSLIGELRTLYQPFSQNQSKKSLLVILEKVLKLLEPTLQENHISINVNNDLSKSYLIETEFLQCLLLLIKNSIEAFSRHEVKEPFISLSFKQEEEGVVIYIKDNAGGIQEKDLNKAFEPYFSTKSLNGSGLGLFITRSIVHDKLKGHIELENTKEGLLVSIKLF